METTKLTLRPSKDIIKLAHKMAKEENTSITQLFSSFIMSRRRSAVSKKRIPIGPLTKSITGIVKFPDDFDYKSEVGDILAEKYGLKK